MAVLSKEGSSHTHLSPEQPPEDAAGRAVPSAVSLLRAHGHGGRGGERPRPHWNHGWGRCTGSRLAWTLLFSRKRCHRQAQGSLARDAKDKGL